MKSSNEALLTFTTELKRIKKVILAAVVTDEQAMDSTRMNSEMGGANSMKTGANNGGKGPTADIAAPHLTGQVGTNHNMDALLKRLMKFKHLEDDNKKLKNLLK